MNTRRTIAQACAAVCIGLSFCASAAPAAPAADSASASRDELVAHVIELLHAEEVPLVKLQSLVVNAVEQAKIGLGQRLPADKVDPVMADIGATAAKTLAEVVPVVRDAGIKLAPSVIGPILREKFTDDELRQLVALLDSPIRKKYEALLPAIQDAIGNAVTQQVQPAVNPKLQDMGKQISARIAQALIAK